MTSSRCTSEQSWATRTPAQLVTKYAMMVNVLGASADMEETKAPLVRALSVPTAGIHWYGKEGSRKDARWRTSPSQRLPRGAAAARY